MVVCLQCDSHYLTCHKKSRLLFALYFSTTSGDCTLLRVCRIYPTRVCPLQIHCCDTVTCRQFLNLTFAPRKTCHIRQQPRASLLSCHSRYYYNAKVQRLQGVNSIFLDGKWDWPELLGIGRQPKLSFTVQHGNPFFWVKLL